MAIKSIDKNNNIRYLSQILTPSNFDKIIRRGDALLFNNKVRKYLGDQKGISHKSIIRHIYTVIEREYRNEYIYKNSLLNKLFLKKYSPGKIIALNEFSISTSIADFVLLNGNAHLYEIKTEYDGFDKLDKQISDYQKFADIINVVTSNKHSSRLADKYSNSPIGIIELQGNKLKTIKSAEEHKGNHDHEVIFKTLHKHEYLEIIRKFFGEIPDVPNTLIFRKSLSLIKEININTFHKEAINILKRRVIRCPDILKSPEIPDELKYICFALNLSQKDYAMLFDFLNQII
jgi:hypothetical protein